MSLFTEIEISARFRSQFVSIRQIKLGESYVEISY